MHVHEKIERQKVCSSAFLAVRLRSKQRFLSHFVQNTHTPFSMTGLICSETFLCPCEASSSASNSRSADLLFGAAEADLRLICCSMNEQTITLALLTCSEAQVLSSEHKVQIRNAKQGMLGKIISRYSLMCLVSRRLIFEALITLAS